MAATLLLIRQGRNNIFINLMKSIKNVDQLNSIDGHMYLPNQPKPNFGQLGLTLLTERIRGRVK